MNQKHSLLYSILTAVSEDQCALLRKLTTDNHFYY